MILAESEKQNISQKRRDIKGQSWKDEGKL